MATFLWFVQICSIPAENELESDNYMLNIRWHGEWKVIFRCRKAEKYNKLNSYFPFFAPLPCTRKPRTQTMTEVEGYHITDPSALQMKLCVFACCSATEQQGQRVLREAVGVRSHFCAKKKKHFAKCRPPSLGGKCVPTAIIVF